jgi:hypothetical protein
VTISDKNMQGWLAPTDIDWFSFLASQPPLEEVNFWTPSSYFTFRAPRGTPFLFKLKAPHSAIAGYGLFQQYDPLPEWLAWEAFGIANGAPSFAAMKARLDMIQQRNNMQGGKAFGSARLHHTLEPGVPCERGVGATAV